MARHKADTFPKHKQEPLEDTDREFDELSGVEGFGKSKVECICPGCGKMHVSESVPAINRTRWVRLSAAVGAMMLTSIYRFSWFLFSFEIPKNWRWSLASLGLIYFSFSVTISLVLLFGAQMKLLARKYDLPAP